MMLLRSIAAESFPTNLVQHMANPSSLATHSMPEHSASWADMASNNGALKECQKMSEPTKISGKLAPWYGLRTVKHTTNANRPQWLAANMVVSSFAIGALAVPVFALGFVDALLTIFFINMLGVVPVCFFSTFGPKFGMRQMILSRFFFGYYGVKLSKTPLRWRREYCLTD